MEFSSDDAFTTAFHNHPLKELEKYDSGWYCNGSQTSAGCKNPNGSYFDGDSGAPRFRCTEGCDYDLCKKCVKASQWVDKLKKKGDKLPQTVKTGVHEHNVKQTEEVGWPQGYTCDGSNFGGCKSPSIDFLYEDPKAIRFRCEEGCNFDLCAMCVLVSVKTDKKLAKTEASFEKLKDTVTRKVAHEHALAKVPGGGWGSFYCDGASLEGGCRAPNGYLHNKEGVIRYHCAAGCNYDLCPFCVIHLKKAEKKLNKAEKKMKKAIKKGLEDENKLPKSVKCGYHEHPVTKVEGGGWSGYGCDGENFGGCKTGSDVLQATEDFPRYHCCCFDLCPKCVQAALIKDKELKKAAKQAKKDLEEAPDHITVSAHECQLDKTTGWSGYSCDGHNLDGGCRSGDDYGVLRYHCGNCNFDLCVACAKAHQ